MTGGRMKSGTIHARQGHDRAKVLQDPTKARLPLPSSGRIMEAR